MIYRPSKETLLRQGLIKKCPVDRKAIENLLGRAEVDLKTAKRNLDDDPECTHTYAYRAMLRSGQALMLNDGYRPDIKDKHKTVVLVQGAVHAQDLTPIWCQEQFGGCMIYSGHYDRGEPLSGKGSRLGTLHP